MNDAVISYDMQKIDYEIRKVSAKVSPALGLGSEVSCSGTLPRGNTGGPVRLKLGISVLRVILFTIKPGPVFTNHSQEHSLSLSPRFANLNVTQLLIG